MAYATLLVERAPDGYALITFNRPDKLNTLSIQLRQELAAVVAELEADSSIHVLILTGAGRAFTAGLDLDEWTQADGDAALAIRHSAVDALLQFSGPTIGAINGLCITGGVEIAMACDLLIASSEAKFADTHVKVGLLPGWGGSARMVQRVGLQLAKELALTGRFFSATEALAWGVLNRVVAPEQLLPEAKALALQMLANPPAGLRAYKQLLDAESQGTLAQALHTETSASQASNAGVTREEIEARLARLRHQGRSGA